MSPKYNNHGQKPEEDEFDIRNRKRSDRLDNVSGRRDNRFRRRTKNTKKGETVKGAKNKLKQFKQATILTVAITGFLLLVFAPKEAGYTQNDTGLADIQLADTILQDTPNDVEETSDTTIISNKEIAKAAKNEALVTIRNIWTGFYSNLPKLLVAIITLVIGWLLTKILRVALKKMIGHWKDGNAIITLVVISVWLFAIGVAVSVVAGDIRALIGSLGLAGLALSWSLQTPIESFTGWLQNSFQGYYRVGDRVNVGDVFGDVYKIDFLTTTVWEIGAPYRQGFVQAEQPTGRLVTFPNNEILSGTVVNLTRDFPYVWDELAIAVANESDIKLGMKVIGDVASEFLGDYMKGPSEQYSKILKKANLNYNVAAKPEIYLSATDSWTNIVIRYLVGARERRLWKSDLIFKVNQELGKEKYTGKIIPVYSRQQIQVIGPDGTPLNAV